MYHRWLSRGESEDEGLKLVSAVSSGTRHTLTITLTLTLTLTLILTLILNLKASSRLF